MRNVRGAALVLIVVPLFGGGVAIANASVGPSGWPATRASSPPTSITPLGSGLPAIQDWPGATDVTVSEPGVVTTGPTGTDVDALTPVMVELLKRYDEVVATILTDPRAAADVDSELVQAYLALFSPDNEFALGVLEFWAGEGEAGRFYRPGPSGVMLSTAVESLTPVSADEVTVTVCNEDSYVVVDASGAVVEASAGRVPGSATAVRVDGVWLLQDLTQGPGTECAPPETTVEGTYSSASVPESTEPESTVSEAPVG